MDTLSPGRNDMLVQPPRASTDGAFPSMDQSPDSRPIAGTTWMRTCGLVQMNSFTTPETVMVFSRSNMAKEWCADAGQARPVKAPKTAIKRQNCIICSAGRNGPAILQQLYAAAAAFPQMRNEGESTPLRIL